jgi:hypothetical protein
MIKNIHLLTYADGVSSNTGLDYSITQQMLIDSIKSKTKYNVIFHTHNLNTILDKKWFSDIKEFPLIDYKTNFPHSHQYNYWNRNGYYNAWKIFLVKEVYDLIGDDDILYYVDSSAYHQTGFNFNIDKLIEYAFLNKNVCGSFGYDVKNNSYNCCDDYRIWDYIYTESNSFINDLLSKPHILNSWFLFSKNSDNTNFINEWYSLATQTLNEIPLIAYHHTVDQSLFNILVYKYGFKCFNGNTTHDANKNHNLVHSYLMNATEYQIQNYFTNP